MLVAAAAAAATAPAAEQLKALSCPPTAFELRDYQEEAIQAVLDGLTCGVTRQLVSLPTGAWRREAGGPSAVHPSSCPAVCCLQHTSLPATADPLHTPRSLQVPARR